MDKKIKSAKSDSKKEYKRWSKSVERDGITKSVNVQEIENGFIISTDTYGDKNGKWSDDCKKYYSETNPLSSEPFVKENNVLDEISKFVDSI